MFALEKRFQYKEAVEAYKAAAAIGEGCQIGLNSGWQGLIKSYWLVLQALDILLFNSIASCIDVEKVAVQSNCSNIAHCLNLLGDFKEAEAFCFK